MVWEVRSVLIKEDSELYLFSFVKEVCKTTWLQGMTGICYRERFSLTDKVIPGFSVCVKDIKDSVWVLKGFFLSQLVSYSVLKLLSAFTLHQAWASCQCLCDLFWLNSCSIGFLRTHPHHWTCLHLSNPFSCFEYPSLPLPIFSFQTQVVAWGPTT